MKAPPGYDWVWVTANRDRSGYYLTRTSGSENGGSYNNLSGAMRFKTEQAAQDFINRLSRDDMVIEALPRYGHTTGSYGIREVATVTLTYDEERS